MKIMKFFFDGVPKRKCGTESMLMIGGLTGLVGSFASSAVASGSSSAAIKANQRENEKNRQFNREEAEKSRDWSSQEWFRQFENQKQEWSRQFGEQSAEWYRQQDYSNQQAYNYWLQQQQYQSPEMQAQRYRDAGINPAAVVGQQSAGAGGLSAAPTSVPQPAPPTGGQVPSPQAASTPSSVAQPTESAPQMLQAFSSLIQSLGTFGKDSMLAKETETLLAQKFRLMSEQAEGQALLNAFQEYENFIQPQLGDFRIQKENALVQEALAAAYLDKDMSKFYIAQAKLTKKLAKKEGIIALHVDQLLNLVGDKLQAYINNLNADTATTNALRQGQVTLLQFQGELTKAQAGIAETDESVNRVTAGAQVNAIVDGAAQVGLINDKIKAEVHNLIEEGNWIEVNNFLNNLNQSIQSVVGVAGAVNGAGMVQNGYINALNGQQRNAIQSRMVDLMQKRVEARSSRTPLRHYR